MTNKPLIFLDVDGVLNCSTTKERFFDGITRFIGIDRAKLRIFQRILEKTGAVFVLSSTWRKNQDQRNHLYDSFDDIPGFAIGSRCIGCTPIHESKLDSGLYIAAERGKEIAAWLEDHADLMPCPVVILDDVARGMGDMMPFLIQTSYDTGLTDDVADRVIERLIG